MAKLLRLFVNQNKLPETPLTKKPPKSSTSLEAFGFQKSFHPNLANPATRVFSSAAQHTLGHRFCPACERLAIMDGELSPEMLFSAAAFIWLDMRVKIGPRTVKDYKRYIKALMPSFRLLPLNEIHIGHLRRYQKERAETAGPGVINKEIGTLLQVRRKARIVDNLDEDYEPLPVPYWTPPKTITDEQEQAFLMALRSNPKWEMVYCYAILALNTGARGCEIRALKIGDVNIPAQEIIIRTAAKNKWAVRPVPLVAAALWAAQRLLEIASEKGSRAPHHYLFPFRWKHGPHDNDRPMTYSGMKKPWTEARELAGVPDFVPHNSRHQAATLLAESGADEMTARSIMGWQNGKMWEHYSTPRKAHKREVMKAAFSGKTRPNRINTG
jgi:integrase